MKRLIPLIALSIGCIALQAQNPFAKLGYTPKIATLSQGEFNEFFDNDTVVQIGSVMFNTKSKQIVAFVKTDTIYSEATLKPDIVSRWLSPDPLAHLYLSWSPYNFTMCNPINLIDPDGRAVWKPGIENGQLVAQKEAGDDSKSLATYLNVDQKQADKLYGSMSKGGSIKLPDNVPGVAQINAAIKDYTNNSDNYSSFKFGTLTPTNYNCWESAISISQGQTPNFSNVMGRFDFRDAIKGGYTDVTNSPGQYKFGQTVIRFAETNFSILNGSYSETTHGATYLGTSRDGTQYTWSKNGAYSIPGIFTVPQLNEKYGQVEGYGAAPGGGFYNPNP